MKGTHIAVTYCSNIFCNCCEYQCAPYKKGWMNTKEFRNKVQETIKEGYGDYLSIEGGEPFLNTAMLFKYLKGIQALKLPIYVTTNGYWGNIQPYYDILRELKKIGLAGINFEYDFYHSISINYETVTKAIDMAIDLGLEVKIFSYFDSETLITKEDNLTFEGLKKMKGKYKNIRFVCRVINTKGKNVNKHIYYRNSI